MLDFYKDIVDDQKLSKALTKVPIHFRDEQHYIDVMLPLFWEEGKMQIHRCKFTEMTKEAEAVKLCHFKMVDGFIKLEFERGFQVAKEQHFCYCDLALFTQGESPIEEHEVHFLAYVDASFGQRLSVTARLPTDSRKGSRAFEVARVIQDCGTWRLAKVCGMSTFIREYEALVSLPKIPLRSILVNRDDGDRRMDAGTEMQAGPRRVDESAKTILGRHQTGGAVAAHDVAPAVTEDLTLFQIPPLLNTWMEGRYNDSQRKAITDSRKRAGITLVQGPPGTGKTTTILGILASLLSSQGESSRAVSYTRTDGADSDEDEDMEGDPIKEAEELAKRQQERIALMQSRTKWFRTDYVSWADATKQELPRQGDPRLRLPYEKIKVVRPMSEVQENVAPQKVLICGPSNAAIDEVLRRITLDGIVDGTGNPKKPPLIRLGPNVDASLEEFSLDSIVRTRLEGQVGLVDLNRREVEKEKVLRDAKLVCVTLSVAGSRDLVGVPFDFDTVVVDEASQGVEVALMIPLKLGCRRLIMVGDPEQLPATCFSTVAIAHDYNRSLFQRLRESQHPVNMLQTQYRMHPAISAFPSKQFYNGLLLNMRDEKEYESAFPAPWWKIPCFGPVAFFHLRGQHSQSAQSLVNIEEADFVVQLFDVISSIFPEYPWRKKVAVISPYAEQVQLIRQKFKEYFKMDPKKRCPVEVNTVDGFQGREKDCIIVSTVRAHPKETSIGFVRDRRRMNVALTRGRLNCWVVGHATTLKHNDDWRAFIELQEEACQFLNVSTPHNGFIARYLDDWYDRHPELPRPDVQQLRDAKAFKEARSADTTVDIEVDKEDAEDDRDGAPERRERDIEEALEEEEDEDFDDRPLGFSKEPVESKNGAADMEEDS